MEKANKVNQHLIQPLISRYGAMPVPEGANELQYKRQWITHFGDYRENDLAEAAQKWMSEIRTSANGNVLPERWPTIMQISALLVGKIKEGYQTHRESDVGRWYAKEFVQKQCTRLLNMVERQLFLTVRGLQAYGCLQKGKELQQDF